MAVDLPTRLDLYAIGRDYVLQKAKKIDPGQIDVEGTDVNITIGAVSVMCDAIIKQLAYGLNRLLLDGAQKDDLDRYALDRYQLTRKGASAALGAVTFTRLTTAAGAGSVPIGTKLVAQNVEYITTTVANFASGDTKSQANVRAVQAGKTSQVTANSITKFSNIGLLFDQTLTVTNLLATAGGEEVEDDDTFKSRIRDFWLTARRGTLGAIEFGAKTVPGVVTAMAVEVTTPGGLPARVVNLFIADSSGVASVALGNQVSTALLDYRAGGIAVIINTSLPTIVTVELHLQFQANVDTDALSVLVQQAVVDFINSLPVNGTLYIGELFSVLQRFKPDGLVPSQTNIVSPVGDVVPTVGQTLRTTLANVTLS